MCISINILKTTPTFQPPAVPDLVMGIAFLFSLKRKSGVVAGVPSVPSLGSYFQYTQWRPSSPFGLSLLLLIIHPPKTNMRIAFDTMLTVTKPQLLQNYQEEHLSALYMLQSSTKLLTRGSPVTR